MRHSLISALIFILIIPTQSQGSNFYDQRFRGWSWFEEQGLQKERMQNESYITPEAAKKEIEQFARELEELKYVMLARPTPENIKTYREKEQEMWTHAMQLQAAWDITNFLYPEQRDQINNPDNVHAVKLKRQLEEKNHDNKIREFSSNFELIGFFKNSCPYSREFTPVFASFAKEYNFKTEEVILDDTKRSSKNFYLIKKLNIESTPVIFVVSKNGQIAFELIRGFVSHNELKSRVIMASEYLKLQEVRSKK